MTKRFSYIKNNSITQYQSLPIQEIGKSKSLHCQEVVDKLNKLFDENEQLKQDRFICLDCKYCGYAEIGCLCEKQDHWEEFKSECNDFKELKW